MKNKSIFIMAVMVCILCCLNVVLFVNVIYNKDSDINNTGNNENINVEDFESTLNSVSKKIEDAAVTIIYKEEVISNDEVYLLDAGFASGIIYKREEIKDKSSVSGYKYYVITNRHVVLDDYNEECIMYIYFGKENLEIEAEILGYDLKVDVAVLSFESTKYIEPVEFGNSDAIETGDFVLAIGTPVSLGYYNTITSGIVSYPLRYLSTDTDGDGVTDFYASYIQHDVAINPGNSGGGLFNLKGELIGINTIKINLDAVDGMGLAIPSNVIKLIAEEYIEKDVEIIRPKFGVTGIDIADMTDLYLSVYPEYYKHPDIYEDKKYGIYVVEIMGNTTIDDTEIDIDDIILEVNGVKLYNSYILNAMLNSLVDFQVGDEVTIKYYDRSSEKIKTTTAILKP